MCATLTGPEYVELGKDVSLTCTADSGSPSFTWVDVTEGTNIFNGGLNSSLSVKHWNFEVSPPTPGDLTSILTIKGAEIGSDFGDEGEYRCETLNPIGTSAVHPINIEGDLLS